MQVEQAKRNGATLKTIDKAMTLLSFFSPATPEFRLTDLARAADMDKVTTMRILASLVASGFAEQHPETKKYRLGTAVLRLARIREASFPVVAVLQPLLDQLTEEVGESTHACLFSGNAMMTIALAEPHRATRVVVDPAQPLPLHATASGLAFLAFADDALVKETLRRLSSAPTFTEHTPVSPDELRACIEQTHKSGCAIASRTLEDDVVGIAAPIFDWHGRVQATIAAVCPTTRMDTERERAVGAAVLRASVAATRGMGGEPPAGFLKKLREFA